MLVLFQWQDILECFSIKLGRFERQIDDNTSKMSQKPFYSLIVPHNVHKKLSFLVIIEMQYNENEYFQFSRLDCYSII